MTPNPILLAVSLAVSIAAATTNPLCSQATRVLVADRPDARDAAGEVTLRPGVAQLPPVSSGLLAPKLMPGWPKQLPIHPSYNFAPMRNLSLVDLDGDAQYELVFPNTDGKVYVFRLDGSNYPGWPVQTIGFGQYPAAVGDLDGDGDAEIVVSTRGLTSGGRLYVFTHDGKPVAGWPKNLNGANVSNCVALADLDGDGKLELIAQERQSNGLLHVFRHDGKPFGGSWPFKMDHVPASSPAVADLDNDGKPEVVFTSYSSLYVTDAQGKLRSGFPYSVASKHSANFSYQSAAFGDLDGDGVLEIVTACHKTGGGCYVFQANGTLMTGFPKLFGGWTCSSPPVLVDLTGNGKLDILCGRAGGTLAAPTLYAFDNTGKALTGFPTSHPGGGEGLITVADVDNDGSFEIFYDSNLMENATAKGYLHCVDQTGKVESGFPLRVEGFTYMNGANIADVDGNGALDIAVVSSNTSSSVGRRGVTIGLYTLAGPTAPGRIAWKTYHESEARRGLERESDRLRVNGHAKLSGSLRLELQGRPGSTFLVGYSLGAGLTPLPGLGVLRLGVPLDILFSATMPASGRVLQTYPIPNDARLRGLTLYMQGLESRAGGGGDFLRQMRWIRVR